MLADKLMRSSNKKRKKWQTKFQDAVSVANFCNQKKLWKIIKTRITE